MTTEDSNRISIYREVADINKEHQVVLVQNTQNNRFFVKKTMKMYSRDVFFYLLENPIAGLPQIIDVVEDENDLIVIEEYVSGETLSEVMSNRKLSVAGVKDIMTKLAEIVLRLHSADPRIIHRDIKPSNIIMCNDGTIRLLDMNAAKFHKNSENIDTSLIGTVEYAAPEQYGFSQSDVMTDIYAMGVLMNVMLTGEYPRNKLAPGAAGEIVKKCTSMDARKRYKSVRLLDNAIAKIPTSGKNQKVDRIILPYAPVGLRTLKWWKIIIAVLTYSTLASGVWKLPLGTENTDYVYRLLIFGGIVGGIFYIFDYAEIKEIIGVSKIKNQGLRVFLSILITLGITSIPIAFTAFMKFFANYDMGG